jgi:hypothetical protein
MRGHEALVAMRKAGALPSKNAFVTDMPTPLSVMAAWERWEAQDQLAQLLPSIDIDPSDDPARMDWRCLVGLTVHITGFDSNRLDAIVTAIEQCNPKRVIASLHDKATGEAIRISDTEGNIEWPN